MPSQQEVRWSQLKVGVIVLVLGRRADDAAVSDDQLLRHEHLLAQADHHHLL